jgi:hypothetical protein
MEKAGRNSMPSEAAIRERLQSGEGGWPFRPRSTLSKFKPQCLQSDLTAVIGMNQWVMTKDEKWSGAMDLDGQWRGYFAPSARWDVVQADS